LGQPVTPCFDEGKSQIILRSYNGQESNIPVNNDRMIINLDVASYSKLHSVITPYQLVYSKDGILQPPNKYHDKIVIIGVNADGVFTLNRDKWRVSDSGGNLQEQWRYGPELHANILSNLLSRVHIVPLSPKQNLAIIFLMGLLGISMQYIFKGQGNFLFLNRKVSLIPMIFFATILFIYFLVAFISYKEWRIIFSEMNYHVITLFITYLVVGSIRRRLGLV
jgi:CHASE2 domain-containing sensor protein